MIKVFTTGGTIDCCEIGKDNKYSFSETFIPKMIAQGKCRAEIALEVLMKKDSLLMTGQDREIIVERCADCDEDQIVITHGTDTMTETAKALGRTIKDKTIVLLGAMIPFNQENSDALFNLGSAIIAVQTLPHGVYIAMNGKIFTWENVRKNKDKMEFETML